MSDKSSSRLLQQTFTFYDAAGSDPRKQVTTYEYDGKGNQTKKSLDQDGDGKPDSITAYEYDDKGNKTQVSLDEYGDGKPDRTERYEYDSKGNLIRETYDSDSDGTNDRITVYEYDGNGNRTKLSRDNNVDGINNRIENYEYDGNGNLTTLSFYTDESDLLYEETGTSRYEYDGNGNLTKLARYSTRSPGSTQTYEYDSNNNLIKESYNGLSTTYEYDSNGNRTKAIPLTSPNTRTETYEYDSNGNRIKETYDYGNDGTNDGFATYGYDGNDNRIKETYDTDGDGNPERVNTYIYSSELTAGDRSGGLEVTSLGFAKSMRLSFDDFGLKGVSELLVFSQEEDGSKTQLASFFVLENGKLSSDYSADTSLDTSLLSPGAQLQLELVENGNVRTGTVETQSDGTAVLDFGNNTKLTVALNDEAIAPNLLREDATTLDLTGYDGSAVMLNFSVYREASYNNTVGFYRTDSANGGITDPMTGETLQPGDEGYKAAALSRQLGVQLSGENGAVSTFSSTVAGGGFLGMFLISNGSDAATGELLFSSLGMNGGNDHAKMLGNNTFGFEDMVGLGDRDFNDMVVKFEVA